MLTYKFAKDKATNQNYGVYKSDGWFIPFDPANTDYQAYLKWLEEGNTPEPAEGEQA